MSFKMSCSLKNKPFIGFVFLFFSLFLATQNSDARGGGFIVGNGGDHVRATFLKMGDEVISFLKETEVGVNLIQSHNLKIDELIYTLDIQKIDIVENGLKDNLEVPVDATGSVGLITLNKSRWMEHFEKDRDVYYLVFHEMLRSIGVNDDNYIISKSLNPFPVQRRIVTRIETVYPLIDSDTFKGVFDLKQLKFAGTGCPSGKIGTIAEYDFERNILDFKFSKYSLIHKNFDNNNITSFIARKDCSVILPFALPQGKRLVVSQIDFGAKFEALSGDQVSLSNEVFFAGMTNPREQKTSPQFIESTLGRLLLRRSSVLKSECGATSGLIRINSSALLKYEKPEIVINKSSLSSKSFSIKNQKITQDQRLQNIETSVVDVDRVSVYFNLESCLVE